MEECNNSSQSDSDVNEKSGFFASVGSFLRRFLFRVLSVGPIPNHVAFIMDGNRRYARKHNMEEGAGHRAGYLSLMTLLKYCYELRVKFVSIYAFSIENFKRRPEEVQLLMNLMLEKIERFLKEKSIVDQYGVRVYFIGNLKLLHEPVQVAAEKVMKATAKNNNCVLLVCVAYTSTDEIVHAVQESCVNKCKEVQSFKSRTGFDGWIDEMEDAMNTITGISHEGKEFPGTGSGTACNVSYKLSDGVDKINNMGFEHGGEGSSAIECDESYAFKVIKPANGVIAVNGCEKLQEKPSIIKLVDIEKHMYMAVAPDPDILIRSSGETRLSEYLLWQTSNCLLYSPKALWPEMGLWQLVSAIIIFQRNHSYLEKKRKQM